MGELNDFIKAIIIKAISGLQNMFWFLLILTNTIFLFIGENIFFIALALFNVGLLSYQFFKVIKYGA